MITINKQQLAAQIKTLAATHIPHPVSTASDCSLCSIKLQMLEVKEVLHLMTGIQCEIINLVNDAKTNAEIDVILMASLLDAFKLGYYLAANASEINEVERLAKL